MKLFQYEKEPERLLAWTEDGRRYTLGDLSHWAGQLGQAVGGHRLVFLLCQNTPGTLLCYLSCLKTGAVPLLLDAGLDPELLDSLTALYHPAFLCAPDGLSEPLRERLAGLEPVLRVEDSTLYRRDDREEPELHPDLALLLTTSGSTGSPKLVRLTGKNLDSNAASIAQYLRLDEHERPVTMLPMNYSYGMSVINSHLLVGAPIFVTDRTILERAFWDSVAAEGITSLVGVPYTYRMYKRVGLMDMDLPALTSLTQAGGKLPEALHREFAAWAEETGRRFCVMYGQTEAAPRMGWLPPEQAAAKCGSMGLPIPGGEFTLLDADDKPIDGPDQVGELVYQGDNVAMGYAQCPADLLLGDQWQGVLHTGDMARRDADGFYYIAGRKKRFIKLYGSRVNLDEVEQLLLARFPQAEFACVGEDDLLRVFYAAPEELGDAVTEQLCARLHFPARAFLTRRVEAIPKTQSGKIHYAVLNDPSCAEPVRPV